jgi:hypothetical protein
MTFVLSLQTHIANLFHPTYCAWCRRFPLNRRARASSVGEAHDDQRRPREICDSSQRLGRSQLLGLLHPKTAAAAQLRHRSQSILLASSKGTEMTREAVYPTTYCLPSLLTMNHNARVPLGCPCRGYYHVIVGSLLS